jgi:hypothetical protein
VGHPDLSPQPLSAGSDSAAGSDGELLYCFALLVTAIRVLPLLTPDRRAAFVTAVALPAITGHANREYGPAIRVAA